MFQYRNHCERLHHFKEPPDERDFSYATGTPRDITTSDVELRIHAPRLNVNGKLDPSTSARDDDAAGAYVWIYVQNHGRYILSLSPHPGFSKTGEVRGSNSDLQRRSRITTPSAPRHGLRPGRQHSICMCCTSRNGNRLTFSQTCPHSIWERRIESNRCLESRRTAMRLHRTFLTALVLSGLIAAPLLAHHSVAKEFDETKATINPGCHHEGGVGESTCVDYFGIVRMPRFIDWHWKSHRRTPSSEAAFAGDFELAKSCSMEIWPSRDGSKTANGRTLTFANGRTFDVHDTFPIPPGPPIK